MIGVLSFGVLIEFLAPKENRTSYQQTSGKAEFKKESTEPIISSQMANLFAAGKRQAESDKKAEALGKKRRAEIKYFAPQIVGENDKGPKKMRSGAKLIGVLKTSIDTRSPALVRVLLPHGGEANGIEIEPRSILVGQFSYGGEGDRLYLTFSRLDPPDGAEPRKISAVGLDAGTFTPGIQGEEFTGQGEKVAASLGLSMFSGMADTLVERESLGNVYGGVQAKSSMRNALLQGASRAAQDQVSRTTSSLDQVKSYVIVPEGKEVIVELLEDYK